MAYIKKAVRKKVHKMLDGHCGYCGCELEYDEMQVDHIEPHWHNMSEEYCEERGIDKGDHDIDNFMPACARCNRWKSTFTIEKFREQIVAQHERVKRDKAGYRLMLDYGLVEPTGNDVVFYFEQQNKSL